MKIVTRGRPPWQLPQTRNNALLIIRTVNTLQGDSEYPLRLKGIAREFHKDTPETIGLIGMQEVKEEMTSCPIEPAKDHGASCFARILGQQFSESRVTSAYQGNLGIVAGYPWVITENNWWVLGKDSWKKDTISDVGRDLISPIIPNPGGRRLLEAICRYGKDGPLLRFYTTHLSHDGQGKQGEQKEQRHEQIENLLKIVSSRASNGELPPIIVGDFNFKKDEEPSSYEKMATSLTLLTDPNFIDQIWFGRFTQNKACNYRVVEKHNVSLTSEHNVDGERFGQLTDHDSIGLWLEITE
jgi:hypothetical protein